MQGLKSPRPAADAPRNIARALARSRLAFCASLFALGAGGASAAAQDAAPEALEAPTDAVPEAVEATDAAPEAVEATDAAPEAVEATDAAPEAVETPPETPAGDAVASDAEASAEAPVETVRVHVLSRRPGVELHVRLGSHVVTTDGVSRVVDDYTLVCAPTPCDANVPTGVHRFGLSGHAGHALPAHDVELAAGLAHTLEIDLDDRSGWRTFGTLVALIVGIPGLVAFLVSVLGPTIDRSRYDAVFIATGASLTAVGIAGLPFAAWGDTREVVLLDREATE